MFYCYYSNFTEIIFYFEELCHQTTSVWFCFQFVPLTLFVHVQVSQKNLYFENTV